MTTDGARFTDEENRGPKELRSLLKTTRELKAKKQSWRRRTFCLTNHLTAAHCCRSWAPFLGAVPRRSHLRPCCPLTPCGGQPASLPGSPVSLSKSPQSSTSHIADFMTA